MTFLLIIGIILQNWNMSQEQRLKLANNVKHYRELNRYTREEVSLSLGFDNSYIGKLEKGKINITIDRLTRIATFFNIEVKDLVK